MDHSDGVRADRADIELTEAVYKGDLLHAAYLIDSGVDVNVRSPIDGWTLLHCACKLNNIAMVSLLIARGADKTLKTKSGLTARELTTSAEIIALLQVNDSPCKTSNYQSHSERIANDLPHNMINRNELYNRLSIHGHEDKLLKVRIANSTDSDFIEVELPNTSITYQNLLEVCCRELEIHPDQVSRIRKLPDTRVRCDADVRRLKQMQELEVVLKDNVLISHSISSNNYPSISANKNQTVLY